MRIVKLKKVKIGEGYPIIRMTYKNDWGHTKVKDIVMTERNNWKFADTGNLIIQDDIIHVFNESSEFEYELNKS